MKRFSAMPFLFAAVIFFSCSKDQDTLGPNPTTPNTIAYNRIVATELRVWVGGEEIDTEGLNVEDIGFDEVMPQDLEPLLITFYEDSLRTCSKPPGDTVGSTHAYKFSNDSLFLQLTDTVLGEPIELKIFLGMGNRYYLIMETHDLYAGLHSIGLFREETLFGTGDFEEAVAQSFVATPADMGPDDTVMVYNQWTLFQ